MSDIELTKPIIWRIGGKYLLKHEVIKHIIDAIPFKTYIELFVGGGSVFFYKPLSEVNVINDLDPFVYNTYKSALKIKNYNFPYTEKDNNKETFIKILNKKNKTFYDYEYLNKISYRGNNIDYGGRFPQFKYLTTHFQDYKYKLERTTILNKDFREVIKKYNKKDSLFYLDPPYSQQKKSWGYITTPSNIDILNAVNKIKGKFILSYDYSLENMKLFKDYNIYIVNIKYASTSIKDEKIKNTKELIICNF
jgi:DNA adenine methylase